MALPTFFIIGAAKAGTTSLHYYLDLHPEVQMSTVKETHFFSGPAEGNPYELGRVDSLAGYEALFDADAAMRGEACPSYTSHPFRKGAPERIHELVPKARFVYLVRDPVARTVSHYQHRVSVGGERRPLSDVLGDLEDPGALRETCMSLYATQLERYLERFPAERVLVVDQADLLASRDATLREVFAFLDVEEDFQSPEFDAELLRTQDRRAYPKGYNRLVRRVVAPALRRVPPPARRALRSRVERRVFKPLPKPVLEDDQRARLEEIYAPEAERLRKLTGKSFSTWSV